MIWPNAPVRVPKTTLVHPPVQFQALSSPLSHHGCLSKAPTLPSSSFLPHPESTTLILKKSWPQTDKYSVLELLFIRSSV